MTIASSWSGGSSGSSASGSARPSMPIPSRSTSRSGPRPTGRCRSPRRSRLRTDPPLWATRGVRPGRRPGSAPPERSLRSWAGRTVEAIVDLGFDPARPGFQAEGLVYSAAGVPIKGLNPRNTWIRVPAGASPDDPFVFFIEAAANPTIVGPITSLGDPATAGTEPLYRISRADLAVFDQEVWELVQDLEVLDQLMRELSLDEPRRWEILRAIERSLDALDLRRRRRIGSGRPRRARRGARQSGPRRAPTGSRRSATPTSTRPGCGRCARRSARWPGPSPTSSR